MEDDNSTSNNNNNNNLTLPTNNILVPAYFGSGLWITIYCVIICAAIAGNILTICAILASRQLFSTISNQFIFSLGVSDLLVGLSIPYHMCFYMMNDTFFGHNKNACLVRFVLIMFACASSILNLLLIGTDRYCAIVHPLRYNRYMTREISLGALLLGWTLSLTISTVPIYWNTWSYDCDVKIVPATYFNFVLTPLFLFIWGLMLLVYLKIWREAYKHAKRIRTTTNFHSNSTSINDTKSIQVVMLTLGSFSICWLPYFIVTTYFRISNNSSKFSLLYEIAFTMAVGNSGVNPIIYAWKNSNFREAFRCLLTCQSPNKNKNHTNYITNHIPSSNSKKSSISNGHHHHHHHNTNHHNEEQGHENLAIDIELNNRYNRNNSSNKEEFDDDDERECSVSTDVTNT